MSWTLLGLRSEHSYSQAATKLQSVNKPGLEGLGYPWQHCSPPGRFPAAFKVFIVDSWLVTECDCWKGSSTAPSLPLQQVGAAPSLASPVGLHTPHLNWDQNPIAVITLLLSPCCYHPAVISLLSLCLVPKPEPNSRVNLCRCPPWKLVLSPKGLAPSHKGSLLSPSPCRMSQVIPLKDAVLKNPGWVWLWEKDKSFLCCRCCFAVVSSFIRALSLFLLKRTLVLLI